ncbi:polyphosphate polymerase domain-containing protein [Williamwhitmania taraxaci]|uniref:VTC domain-containing protein n=1 Tax=Williamwhitmania taraxaci TaxID=1640674 RepID=A0A1G6GMR5_9BACT|nr:polyphosphate polymerase domain-containing protein [Williamwhitmania taraxaci]SDB83229.1 VTC domain-containing protein [Williamwhitmania taraxaci]
MIPLEEKLHCLNPVRLSEIDNLKLLNRVDKKYLLTETEFVQLSERVAKMGYNVLTINSNILQAYETTYYDTPNLQFYLDHHNKRLNRVKIRIRKYNTTGDIFLEIKKRVNKGGETQKKRMLLEECNIGGDKQNRFITKHSGLLGIQLQPVAKTNFERATLTSEQFMERITIDFNLTVIVQDLSFSFKDLIILEVKRAKDSGNNGISNYLKEKHIHPISFSKYCLAVAMFHPTIKHNAFKPLLQKLKTNFHGNIA